MRLIFPRICIIQCWWRQPTGWSVRHAQKTATDDAQESVPSLRRSVPRCPTVLVVLVVGIVIPPSGRIFQLSHGAIEFTFLTLNVTLKPTRKTRTGRPKINHDSYLENVPVWSIFCRYSLSPKTWHRSSILKMRNTRMAMPSRHDTQNCTVWVSILRYSTATLDKDSLG